MRTALHRRSFITMSASFAACSGDNSDVLRTFSVSYNEFAAARTGDFCLINPMSPTPNSLIKLDRRLSDRRNYDWPVKSAKLIPSHVTHGCDKCICTIIEEEQRSASIAMLNLETGDWSNIPTPDAYVECPLVSADGDVVYFGRSADEQALYLKSLGTGQIIDGTPFQVVTRASVVGSSIVIAGIAGRDPFDALSRDRSGNLTRTHVINPGSHTEAIVRYTLANPLHRFAGVLDGEPAFLDPTGSAIVLVDSGRQTSFATPRISVAIAEDSPDIYSIGFHRFDSVTNSFAIFHEQSGSFELLSDLS